jgi:hypothetical protein
MYGPSLQRDAALSLSLQESLRGLMRAINTHEKETLRYCEQNMYLLNYISMQHDLKFGKDVANTATEDATIDANGYPTFPLIKEYLAKNKLDDLFKETETKANFIEGTNIEKQVPKSRIIRSYGDKERNNNAEEQEAEDEVVVEKKTPKKTKKEEVKEVVKEPVKEVKTTVEKEIELDEVWTSNWNDDDEEGDLPLEDDFGENNAEEEAGKEVEKEVVDEDHILDAAFKSASINEPYIHMETLPDGTVVKVLDVKAAAAFMEEEEKRNAMKKVPLKKNTTENTKDTYVEKMSKITAKSSSKIVKKQMLATK